MRRTIVAMLVTVALVAAAAPAGAAPPDRFEEPVGFDFPDPENGVVAFINTTREAVCTEDQVQAEEDFLIWFEDDPENALAFFQYLDENDGDPTGFGGEFPPPEPPRPDGIVPLRFLQNETRKGAIVESVKGSNLPTELWVMDEDAPLVGPCLDTDDTLEVFASGKSNLSSNDNDLFGSETRGNAFGFKFKAFLTGAAGEKLTYGSHFHLNSQCHVPEDGPPSCLIEEINVLR